MWQRLNESVFERESVLSCEGECVWICRLYTVCSGSIVLRKGTLNKAYNTLFIHVKDLANKKKVINGKNELIISHINSHDIHDCKVFHWEWRGQ